MVVGQIKERLEGYLQRNGLGAADIPAVVGVFTVCKVTTAWALIAVGIRFRPITYVFRSQRPRQLVRNELSRTTAMDTEYANLLHRAKSAVDHAGRTYRNRQDLIQGKFRRLRSESSERLRSKCNANRTFTERAADWYFKTTEKYSEKLATNWLWLQLAALARQEPKNLAKTLGIGVVEGMVLNKLLFLIYAPIELYVIVRFFQARNRTLPNLPGDDVTNESSRETWAKLGKLVRYQTTYYEEKNDASPIRSESKQK